MPPRIRLAVLAALSLPIGLHVEAAVAQQSTPDMSTLLKKLDEQEKRIEALEKELHEQKEEIAQAAGTPGGRTKCNTNAGFHGNCRGNCGGLRESGD